MGLEIKKDGLADLLRAVKSLTGSEVLVGIPDTKAERQPEPGEPHPASNATIGYTMEFGEPDKNIPARPFLLPGIQSVKDKIINRMRAGGEAALKGRKDAVEKTMEGAGLIAANAVQQKITDGPFAPLAPATIQARADRGRKGAKQYLKLLKQGVPADVLNDPGVGLVKPLIDTGQLRRAVSYVVRKKGEK
jgi:hypothetical protein